MSLHDATVEEEEGLVPRRKKKKKNREKRQSKQEKEKEKKRDGVTVGNGVLHFRLCHFILKQQKNVANGDASIFSQLH